MLHQYLQTSKQIFEIRFFSSLRIRFLSVVQEGAMSRLFGGSPVRR